MRIHSDYLKSLDVYRAVDTMPGVYAQVMEVGSRSHARAFEVRLTGTSPYRTMDGEDQAATWDEWGVFFAILFNLDANMIAGSVKSPNYANAGDFHYQTGTRFADLTMPDDTHPRHKWELDGHTMACTKCTATLSRRI